MDAKLELSQSRADARDAVAEQRFGRLEDRIDNLQSGLQTQVAEAKAAAQQTGMEVRSLKSTIIITGIGAVLTILFGIAGFNATLLANMTGSFESGKTTATAAAEVKQATVDARVAADRATAQPATPTKP